MLRVSDRVESEDGSRVTPSSVWPSALHNCVGAPDIPISRLDAGLWFPLSTLSHGFAAVTP